MTLRGQVMLFNNSIIRGHFLFNNIHNIRAFRILAHNSQSKSQELNRNNSGTTAAHAESKKEDIKNLIILHIVPRARTLPSPSPYVMKLWTFMNMANIPYKIDTKKSMGPKGRSPWITIDGQEIGDSQIIINHLKKKFGIDFGKPYTKEQLAISTATRIMMEEHYVWGGISLWRTQHGGLESSKEKVFKLADTFFVQIYFKYVLIPKWKWAVKAQGMGVHSKEEVMEFMFTDLRTVSNILGKKPYILGDTPCEDDCGIFGVLAQTYWGSPGSPYEKFLKEEVPNLGDYCERIKTAYWPDWNKQLARV